MFISIEKNIYMDFKFSHLLILISLSLFGLIGVKLQSDGFRLQISGV